MTSWHSLLACAQAEVTIERITSLAANTGTEPLTVDFKEKAGPWPRAWIRRTGCRRCFEVPLGDDKSAKHVLVIRIRPELAPRPVMVQRTGPGGDGIFWIPVRIPGGTRQATRAEMAALFAEKPGAGIGQPGYWDLDAPQVPTGPDGLPDPGVDMVLKTGLGVMPGPACPGRPLSEAVLDELAAALDKSPLASTLFTLTGLMSGGIYNTQRQGRPNTSGTATLVWQIASRESSPFQMTVRVVAPGQYGHSHIQTLTVSIEIVSRLSSWLRSPDCPQPPPPGAHRRLETPEWAALLDAMMATPTDPRIVAAIADLADVHPVLVPPPRILHVVTGPEIAGFLPPLRPIAGATGSHGAHLETDPALTLADPGDRGRQVTRWLCQIAADAGLLGMERLTKLQPPEPRAVSQPTSAPVGR
jgi:hypothetical protein